MDFINQGDLELLEDLLLKSAEEIRTLQISKGLYASGKSAAELDVNIVNTIGQIVDPAGSLEYQERGRGPGGVNYKAIYDWLQWKKYGMNWESERERKTLAFLIARKIARYGTSTHIKGSPTGVISEPINAIALQEFITTLTNKKAIEITSDMLKDLTQ